MSNQRTGLAIFAGLLIVTGVASSGWLFDSNALLDRYVKEPLMAARDDAQSSSPSENQEQETAQREQEADTSTQETNEDQAAAVETQSEEPADTAENSEPDNQNTEVADQQPEPEQTSPETAEAASEEAAEQSDTQTAASAETESAPVEPAETGDSISQDASPTPQETTENEIAEAEQPSAEAAPAGPPPVFDLLRVEPNGDMVVAGVAQPGSEMELVAGTKTLTKTTANDRGEFVAILDEPLEPGDYEIVLRATNPDGVVMSSEETAIVSIPENGSEGVIALVEVPGAPSRLITTPQVQTAQANQETPAQTEAETAQSETASEETQIAEQQETPAAVEETAKTEEQGSETETPTQTIRIEAVEIDGPTIFVAGAAEPGTKLRVYANEILLGDTIASAQGRFLIDVNRDLPVGDYIIRADALSANGSDVVLRAAVPFTRSAGERLAAVAVPAAPLLPDEPPQIPAASENTATGNQVQETAANTASNSNSQVVSAAPASDEKQADISANPETSTQVGGTQAETAASSEQQDGSTAVVGENNRTETDQSEGVQVASKTLNEPLKPVEGSVVIRRGDTLWHISRRVYGRGIKYTTIYRANEDQIRDPDMIWPGQVFALPEKADEDEN